MFALSVAAVLVVHERRRVLELGDPVGRARRHEGSDEVEPVLPVLGHRRRRDGAVEEGAGVEAQALDDIEAEFVVLIEVVQKPLVDGVEVDD
jgi:hypothetical protein